MGKKKLACDRVLALMLLTGSLAAGCSGSPSSPSPLPTPPVGSDASPSPVTFTLLGRVTETAPTTRTGIGGATVSVTSEPGAGKSAVTNSLGYYSIENVAPGSTIKVSAQGYLESTLMSGREGMNFQLMPLPQILNSTMSDTLGEQVGTCSDGLSMKPCHILTIAIHNRGPLEANLTWDPAGGADLDLSLFRTGESTFISRSASQGTGPERIGVDLTEGATYELRVTYASGNGAPKYTLRVAHQS